jgi:hypothetical protein
MPRKTARALTADEFARLPALLRAAKVVIAIDYRLKTDTGREIVHSFRTASLVDLDDLRKDVRAGLLIVLEGSL